MTDFNIIQLHDELYDYLLIATSHRSSLSDIEDFSELKLAHGKVLFDFMLIHGMKHNRFIECNMRRGCFERKSIQIAESVSEDIRYRSSIFFRNNTQLVNNSILPKSMQHLIVAGEVV